MSAVGRLLGYVALALTCVACGGTSPPKSSFEYALPAFSTELSQANFEYVKFGAVGRVSIPGQREQMKQSVELGLVNEALTQIWAQAPPGVGLALTNVVVVITEKTETKEAVFTSTKTTKSDLELVIRADIVRFKDPARFKDTARFKQDAP
ncbi:MAG: hypothetical protein H6718_35585 [Polyangiaceae bacterium]|nr:hypothetical protein [Myxococcales bacterium]MCB9590785.1 hypothetical protein [Polyangiaceae bacterium]MCB9610396.1 hypothetical protein [Polyangiaceae bacterium]